MFRDKDHDWMLKHIDLVVLQRRVSHQDAILSLLRDSTMPCDGAWPPERVAVFQRWIAGGSAP